MELRRDLFKTVGWRPFIFRLEAFASRLRKEEKTESSGGEASEDLMDFWNGLTPLRYTDGSVSVGHGEIRKGLAFRVRSSVFKGLFRQPFGMMLS